MRMSKFLLVKIWIFAAFLLGPSMQAAAVEDGAYVGFFQVTYAIPEANRELNDTGELLLVIEDNKIVDIQYDDEGFVKGKVTYKLKIDKKTGKLSGYFIERDRLYEGNRLTLRWQMKGVFAGEYFAGNATIYLTQWNGQTPEAGMLKIATYAFESP